MSSIETELKLELKAWEYAFKKENGRNPEKEDIKKNKEISDKYKQYKVLKHGPSKREPKLSTPSKRRTKLIPQFHTPHKTSPAKEPETPIEVDELGPTPQLNGRVLGLFEVITSPKTTPQNSTVVTKENITLTPAKKTLDFSGIGESEDDGDKFKTPQKPSPVKHIQSIQQTPLYLRPGGSKDITASPSPLATQRIKKGLSTIISEFRDIQAELKYGDFDEEELDIGPLADIDEEAEDAEEEEGQGLTRTYKKKKTQKRTTRRYVIKARPNTDGDDMVGKDVKKELERLESIKDQASESEESEEWSDGPDEFIPRARSAEDGQKRVAQSRNFKRLKLRDGKSKRNFGRRSRGY